MLIGRDKLREAVSYNLAVRHASACLLLHHLSNLLLTLTPAGICKHKFDL